MSRSLISSTSLFALAVLGACNNQGQPGNVTAADNASANAEAAATTGNASTAAAGPAPAMAADQSIAANLAASPMHGDLVRAIDSAGLKETFSGSVPYTLFAPTDAAFAKLPAGAADNLMKPEAKGQLTHILTYHAVPGVVASADLSRAVDAAGGTAELATVGGGNLKVSKSGDALIITDAKGGQARVTSADQVQSNGVVHVIDTVLMPN